MWIYNKNNIILITLTWLLIVPIISQGQDNCEDKVRRLNQIINSLNEVIGKQKESNEGVKMQLAQKEKEKGILREDNKRLKQEKDSLNKQLEQSKNKTRLLELEMKEDSNDCRRYQEELFVNYKKETKRLEEEIIKKDREISDKDTECKKNEKAIKDLYKSWDSSLVYVYVKKIKHKNDTINIRNLSKVRISISIDGLAARFNTVSDSIHSKLIIKLSNPSTYQDITRKAKLTFLFKRKDYLVYNISTRKINSNSVLVVILYNNKIINKKIVNILKNG